MATVQPKKALRIATVALILAFTLGADALRCYAGGNSQEEQIECGMHTGCIKKFYPKTQKVVEKGCFLASTNNTSNCHVEDNTGLGVCICTANLCNAAGSPHQFSHWILLLPSSLLSLLLMYSRKTM